MKINIPLEIGLDDFESVIVTALEGGSNYWYYLPQESWENLPLKDEPLSIRIANALYNDPTFKLKVNDAENENDELGELTQESLIKAFQSKPAETLDIINGDFDAFTADVLFQYAVMGEVVFG